MSLELLSLYAKWLYQLGGWSWQYIDPFLRWGAGKDWDQMREIIQSRQFSPENQHFWHEVWPDLEGALSLKTFSEN